MRTWLDLLRYLLYVITLDLVLIFSKLIESLFLFPLDCFTPTDNHGLRLLYCDISRCFSALSFKKVEWNLEKAAWVLFCMCILFLSRAMSSVKKQIVYFYGSRAFLLKLFQNTLAYFPLKMYNREVVRYISDHNSFCNWLNIDEVIRKYIIELWCCRLSNSSWTVD